MTSPPDSAGLTEGDITTHHRSVPPVEDTARKAAALVGRDFGTWSRNELTGIIADLGWSIDQAESDDWALAVDAGEPVTASVHLRRDGLQRYGYGECIGIRLIQRGSHVDITALHAEVLRALTEVLGDPPLVGGPGAWALWRRPDVRIQAERRLRKQRAVLSVDVDPTGPTEADEYSSANHLPDWEPPYAWFVEPDLAGAATRSALDGMMTYNVPDTDDWAAFADRLRGLFASWGADIPVLGRYVPAVTWTISPQRESSHFVQGWFAADEIHLETGDAPGVTSRTTNGLPGMTVPPSADSGRSVADLALQAIGTWELTSPRELRYHAWANNKPARLTVTGLPILHRR